MNTSPYVIVFAGPNGSGKTSLINAFRDGGLQTMDGILPMPEYFINPDQVAKDLKGSFADQDSRNRSAFDAALKLRTEAMNSRRSFAFETVMSHPSRLNEMLMLKEKGYRVFLAFITTESPEKNVERVTLRYQTGTTTGHYVPPDRVRERYERSLALLPRATEIADAALVYDNSVDFQKSRLQAASAQDSPLQVAPEAKEWVLQRLVQPLQQREREANILEKMLMKRGMEPAIPDELRGHYAGPVILSTTQFVAQHDERTGKVVIHDRLMLDTEVARLTGMQPRYRENEKLLIQYSTANAPEIACAGRAMPPQPTSMMSRGRARKS